MVVVKEGNSMATFIKVYQMVFSMTLKTACRGWAVLKRA